MADNTYYFVNTLVQASGANDAFTLGSGNHLVVTENGIIAAGSGNGIQINGDNNRVVMSGAAYGFWAIASAGNQNYITVSGQASGYVGISLDGTGSRATITHDAVITGDLTGVTMSGSSELVLNDGDVSGGSCAIAFFQAANGKVVNNGTLYSTGDGVSVSGSGSAVIINTGSILAQYDAFYIRDTNMKIFNSGSVQGGVDVSDLNLVSKISLENNGTWNGTLLDFGGGDDILHNTGSINAQIKLGTGLDTFFNSGAMTGDILSLGADASIRNTGTVTGDISSSGTESIIRNTGTVTGGIFSSGDASILNNAGTIFGGISLAGLGDTLVNKGTVFDDVSIATNGTLINQGTIGGNVLFGDGSNTLSNIHGTILGSVTGGSGIDNFAGGASDDFFYGNAGNDILSGRNGDDLLSGGANNDTLIGGRGDDQMSGGAGKDSFIFQGAFGDDTITDFSAGTGSNHDILKFAHNDFANFADLQAHMAQAGSDVLITHGADTLTLANVTLANLVSADFLFG